MSGFGGSTAIAISVVVGAFIYLIYRGGSDTGVLVIISGALGTVLSYFFANHIANGAADKALNARIASTGAQNVVVSSEPEKPQD